MIVVDLGDGYYIRGCKRKVGSIHVVAIDWEHPNFGFFTDAMLWYKSPHILKWTPVSIVKWSNKYKNLPQFLEDFPDLKNLFEN